MIYLIGMMLSGKTTIGYHLSRRLKWPWYDVDQWIEMNEQTTISSIMDKKGIDYFRSLEEKALATIQVDKSVISCGGGIILTPGNRERLKKQGYVIYLEASISTLTSRLTNQGISERPLLKNNPTVALQTIFDERKSFYEETADYILNTDPLTIEETIETIINHLKTIGKI